MIHFTSTLRASALNGKVKEVDLDPNVIGVEARLQLQRIVVEGFNTALKMVGNNKAYQVNAGCLYLLRIIMFMRMRPVKITLTLQY
jgi:hypothetical protein